MTFYGANRPGSSVSQGLRDSFWLQAMQSGFIGVLECIKAFSETDFTSDLKKFDVPTRILHGDDDQVVPTANSALLSAKLVQNATLKVYSGASHGLCSTHKKQVKADLLAFIREYRSLPGSSEIAIKALADSKDLLMVILRNGRYARLFGIMPDQLSKHNFKKLTLPSECVALNGPVLGNFYSSPL